jgi:predicted MFS family arabinose efflux permease
LRLNHPFIELAKDAPIRGVWAGLNFQCVSDELFRMAVIWLAIDLAGAAASFVPAAQFVAAFVVSILAGAVADRYSPRATMAVVNLLRGIVALIPAALAAAGILNLWTLMVPAVLLASMRGFFDPALMASVPRLVKSEEQIQALNSLFDSVHRLTRLIGPFLGGLIALVLPVVHLLTAAGISYVAGAATIWRVKGKLDVAHGSHGGAIAQLGVVQRMLHGFSVVRRDRAIRWIFIANMISLYCWILGLTLGLPMLVAADPPSGFEHRPLVALSLILGAYGIGDFLANVWVADYRPVERWRFMFSGYLLLGFGTAAIPAPMAVGLGGAELPATMAIAFAAGAGGPIFFIPMLVTLQSRCRGADLTSVFRLRIALTSMAMALGSLSGAVLFQWPGPVATVVFSGLAVASVGLWGVLVRPPDAAPVSAGNDGS